MPEVWMNYGPVDVVADIRAENLSGTLGGGAATISHQRLDRALEDLVVDGNTILVVLHDTLAIRHTISRLYEICEKNSVPFPQILADEQSAPSIRKGLPQGSVVGTFSLEADKVRKNLTFIAEMGPDGLFGYQTVCTRLLRRFGGKMMLDAYNCRAEDAPMPGATVPPYEVAREFVQQFDVSCVDVSGGVKGLYDMYVGHPADCDAQKLAQPYVSGGINSARTAMGAAVLDYGNNTLAGAMQSLWAIWKALKSDSQAVLLAECGNGLGSEALIRHVEGRMGDLCSPSEYVSGMEDILFVQTVTRDVEVILVTALPELYADRIGVTAARQAQAALDNIIKSHPRRKITILPDAGRTILQESGREGGAEDG